MGSWFEGVLGFRVVKLRALGVFGFKGFMVWCLPGP